MNGKQLQMKIVLLFFKKSDMRCQPHTRCQMNIKSFKTRFLYLVQFLFVLGIILII